MVIGFLDHTEKILGYDSIEYPYYQRYDSEPGDRQDSEISIQLSLCASSV